MILFRRLAVTVALCGLVACENRSEVSAELDRPQLIAIRDTAFAENEARLPDQGMILHRISSAAVTADGLVIVGLLSGGGALVHVLDSIARPIRSFGSEGGGPSEFAGVGDIIVGPDGYVGIHDPRRRRLLSGTLSPDSWTQGQRSAMIHAPVRPLPSTIDGKVVFAEFRPMVEKGAAVMVTVLSPLDTIGMPIELGVTWPADNQRSFGPRGGPTRLSYQIPTGCSAQYLIGGTGEQLIVADPANASIRLRDLESASADPLPLRDVPDVTSKMVSNLRALVQPLTRPSSIRSPSGEVSEGYSLNQQQMDALVNSLLVEGNPVPAVWDELLVDVDKDVIWLRLAECGTIPETERWELYSIIGSHLGDVSLPPGHHILAVRSGKLITTYKDSMDVEHLAAWTISGID